MVARRMTSASVASDQPQPCATSIARTVDVVPSSLPTRTIPPNGPATNDSAGRLWARTERAPSRPSDSRWPASVPVSSITGSIRNQASRSRSARPAGAGAAATLPGPVGPVHGGGVQERGPAPSVVVERVPRASTPITPGPSQRIHRDSNTIELLRRDVVAGGGRGGDGRRRHVSATYRNGPGGT